jgi:glycosyltransferase involved in cell wall biosynthesis
MDVGLLAAEITRWLNDENLRLAAARRAIPFVAERFDWDVVAREWVGHYQKLIHP